MTSKLFVGAVITLLAGAASGGGELQARDVDDAALRAELAAVIVSDWSDHVEAVYGIDGATWARRMTATFEAAPLPSLQQAVMQSDFQAMSVALLEPARGGSALALGDAGGDLVFTPVTACRIADTRLVGGPIGQAQSRNFIAATTTSFAGQGGADGTCGIPLDASAIAVTLTAARPAVEGYVTTHPVNSPRPLATSLTFQGDLRNDSNSTVIALCTGGNCQPEFTAYAHRQTDLVIDVEGYFAPPQATALDCTTVTDAGQLDLLSVVQPRSVSCPAGYAATGGGCGGALGIGVSYSRPSQTGGQNTGWTCGLVGSLLSVLSYEVNASCCRVPGR